MKIRKLGLAIALTVWGSALGIGVSHAETDTLYEDMGGADNVRKIASDALDNYLADDRIKHSFDESNIDRVRQKLEEQFCVVAGGPCTYTGHNMVITHKGLHLTDADFNAVVEDLQKAMDKDGVPFPVQNRFLARLAPLEREIVTR